MGKEIAIIFVILIIIFSSHFVVSGYLESTADSLISKISTVKENIDNYDEANSVMNELYNEWEKSSEVWTTIILHEELDKIELSMISAQIALENNNLDEAVLELGELDFLIKHIVEKEKFNLKNVF